MDGRAEDLEALYAARYPAFRNALAAVTGSRESARDAVQEGFARALATRASYRGDGPLAAWVWRIALRAALEQRGRAHEPLGEFASAGALLHAQDPELADAIRALSPRKRLIVFLRYFGDFTYEEIAAACGVAEGNRVRDLDASARRAATRAETGRGREMIDADLRSRFARVVDEDDDSSWSDVVARAEVIVTARRRRRRLVTAAVVIAVVLVVAAPAVALKGRISQLFADTPPAPGRVVESFAGLDKGVPPDLGTGVIATEARKAFVAPAGNGGSASVWLAPTRRGGFCTIVELATADGATSGAGGDCLVPEQRLDATVVLTDPLVYGYVGYENAESLELEFEDGSTAAVPFAWIGEPVRAGVYVYPFSPDRLQPGHLPTTLRVLDGDGNELAKAPLSGFAPG